MTPSQRHRDNCRKTKEFPAAGDKVQKKELCDTHTYTQREGRDTNKGIDSQIAREKRGRERE